VDKITETFDFCLETALADLRAKNLSYDELLLKAVLMEQLAIIVIKLTKTEQEYFQQQIRKATIEASLMSSIEGAKIGIQNGLQTGAKQERTLQAKKGADARHVENNINKNKAREYYQTNRASFANKDEAAEYICKNVISSAAFATIRGYLRNA